MNDANTFPLDSLLAHRDWLRGLARALVDDSETARDVEQQTWLTAVETPPAELRSPRAWLASVARNHARTARRSESRRRERERAGVRRGTAESAAELAARADLHRRVVEAVVGLEEPYRQAVLLRWFEGLSVREVAARSEVEVETAKSRLHRGLGMLRSRLSAEMGRDGRAWQAALLPLLAAGRKGGSGVVLGGLAAATVLKVLAVAGCVAAAIVLAWTWSAAPVPPRPGTVVAQAQDEPRARPVQDDGGGDGSAAGAAAPVGKEGGEEPGEPALEEPERRAVDAPVAAGGTKVAPDLEAEIGEFRVSNVGLIDALTEVSSLGGIDIAVTVELQESESRGSNKLTLQMSALSVRQLLSLLAQFHGLEWAVEDGVVVVHRKGLPRDRTRTPIRVPRRVIERPEMLYLAVRGRVLGPAGEAVPGAALLWITAEGESRPAGMAAQDGTFTVRATRPFAYLSASAPGSVPSTAVRVGGLYGETIDLDLTVGGPAASLSLRFVDGKGERVAGVRVRIGAKDQGPRLEALPGDRVGLVGFRQEFVSSDSGVVEVDTAPPFNVTVEASRLGFAVAHAQASVAAGRTLDLEIRMHAGETWAGVVRDAKGDPAQGARVLAHSSSVLGTLEATTDSEGRFRVEGIAPGAVTLWASHDGRSTTETREVRPGESISWNPELVSHRGTAPPNAVVRGRVVATDGTPLVRWQVTTLRNPAFLHRTPSATTGEDGSFALTERVDVPVRIGVSRPPNPALLAVREISGPDAEITFIVDPSVPCESAIHGRLPPGDTGGVRVRQLAGGHRWTVPRNRSGRTFDVPGLPAGDYELTAVRRGEPEDPIGVFTVDGTDEIDLGELPPFARGTLRLTARRSGFDGDPRLSYSVERRDGDGWMPVLAKEWQLEEGASQSLPPGSYRVVVTGREARPVRREFDVLADTVTGVDVEILPAGSRRLALRFGGAPAPVGEFEIRDEEARWCHSGWVRTRDGEPGQGQVEVALAPGTYRISMRTVDGRKLTGSVTVGRLDLPDRVFPVDLR